MKKSLLPKEFVEVVTEIKQMQQTKFKSDMSLLQEIEYVTAQNERYLFYKNNILGDMFHQHLEHYYMDLVGEAIGLSGVTVFDLSHSSLALYSVLVWKRVGRCSDCKRKMFQLEY